MPTSQEVYGAPTGRPNEHLRRDSDRFSADSTRRVTVHGLWTALMRNCIPLDASTGISPRLD